MPLVSLAEVLDPAYAAGRGVGAFNVIGVEHAEGIVAGAESAGLPVVLQVSENCVRFHAALAPIGDAVLAIARAAPREISHLVLREARVRQHALTGKLYLPSSLLVRENRRQRMKHCAGLEGQLIVRKMRGRKGACDLYVIERLFESLPGQRIHKIQIEIPYPGGLDLLDGSMRVVGRMNAAQDFQRPGIEALRAQGDAVDARVGVTGEPAALDRAWICLQGNFRIVRKSDSLLEDAEQPRKLLWLKQARRSAAEKHRVHPPVLDPRRLDVEVPDERIDVRRIGLTGLQLMRIEIAVRAFAHAPGHVHVKRQRFADHTRLDRGPGADIARAASASRSARIALPRWLKAFFCAGSSSAAVRDNSGSQK